MFGRMMKVISTAALAALMLAGPAYALDNLNGQDRTMLRMPDLQILESRQQRREFQQQQQYYREQDRGLTRQQRLDLRVPRMQRNCQALIFGNNWSTKCR